MITSRDDDRDPVLACSPANAPHTTGAVKITATCGHEVWISEAGLLATLNDPRMTTQCLRCMPPDAEYGGPVPGAEDELARDVGQATAQQMIAHVQNAFDRRDARLRRRGPNRPH